jgi:cell filamentation protein
VLGGLSIDYAKHDDIKKETVALIHRMKSELWKKLSLEQKAERFSKYLADLWKIHPFREGNTRTITHFCCQYAEKNGISINDRLFAENSAYLRNALVAANSVFDDLGDKSKPEYLHRIILDAMQKGVEQKKQGDSVRLLNSYKVNGSWQAFSCRHTRFVMIIPLSSPLP